MKNIDIYIPPKAFAYLIHNGTLDRTVTPGKPKYVVYYRKRDNTLGGTTLSLDKFGTFAEMCIFPSRKEKEMFFDEFYSSLYKGIADEKKINYRWRTYNWHTK